MKVFCLLAFASLGAMFAQTAPGSAPAAPPPAMPNLPDDTEVAVFGDGTKLTMGEFRQIYAALPPANQQMALRNRAQWLHQWELLRKLTRMAEDAKLDQQSPYKENLAYARMNVLATAEIGAASKQISETSTELVKAIDEVSHVAKDAGQLANSGQTAIGRMETTMRQIMEASGSITGKLAVLREKTTNINSVVTTITKVADQTNLLSLNAAIEAEKAGEYGLGFAVVAMEIRRLADQTAVATFDIERMVKEMQSAVAAGVMGMDKFSEEVRRRVEEVNGIAGQLGRIIDQVRALGPEFEAAREGVNAQTEGAQQISEAMVQLAQTADQTRESLGEFKGATEQLNAAVQGLQGQVSRFKIGA